MMLENKVGQGLVGKKGKYFQPPKEIDKEEQKDFSFLYSSAIFLREWKPKHLLSVKGYFSFLSPVSPRRSFPFPHFPSGFVGSI